MLFVELIRWAIFLSFLLLLVEGIAAIIVYRRFVRGYLQRHAELQLRITAIEHRLGMEHK